MSANADTLQIIVMMGVSGAGKTEVGRALAAALDWRFIDGDDYHARANIEKMHRGEPLTDVDRAPWLAALREILRTTIARGEHAVLACSALKAAYREALRPDNSTPAMERFVYLDVPATVLRERLERRQHHFAPPELLASQLETLEEPEEALRVDGARPVVEIVQTVRDALGI